MNLPPLPLIPGWKCADGIERPALFIDNSIWMEGMSTCYRYLEFKGIRQRILNQDKIALDFGTSIHLALEHRYRTYGHGPVGETFFQELAEPLTKFFAEHPAPDGDWRNLNWCFEILRRYIDRYSIEDFSLLAGPDGKPLVELPFALELYTHSHNGLQVPVIYSGRIDLPVFKSNHIFVLDHKSSSALQKQFWNEMEMTAQQRGYVWAFSKLTGKDVAGYIVDGIRTKEPPAYVIDPLTKKRKALNPAAWWAESFNRQQFLLSKRQIESWHYNTIDLVEEFFFHYHRDYMPQKTKWCASYGKCPYFEVCKMADYEDQLSVLRSDDFKTNTWSPLKPL